MNRSFLATFVVTIAFVSGCAASKHALQPTLPLKNPFASDDDAKTAAPAEGAPATPSSAPAVATTVPPPAATPTLVETVVGPAAPMVYLPEAPSGLASLFGPLVGCERGVYSLQVINGSPWVVQVFLDGVPLAPAGPFGSVPYLAPKQRLFTCLPSLGEHRVEVKAYEPVGLPSVLRPVASYGKAVRFTMKLGPEVRQTVVVRSDHLYYAGW